VTPALALQLLWSSWRPQGLQRLRRPQEPHRGVSSSRPELPRMPGRPLPARVGTASAAPATAARRPSPC